MDKVPYERGPYIDYGSARKAIHITTNVAMFGTLWDRMMLFRNSIQREPDISILVRVRLRSSGCGKDRQGKYQGSMGELFLGIIASINC